MDDNTLLYLIAAAVAVSAIALVIQAVSLFVVARAATKINSRLGEWTPQMNSMLATAGETVRETRVKLADLAAKASETLESTRSQLLRTDEFLAEATSRARIQMDRVELVLDDSLGRIHETVSVLNSGVLRPLRELNGIAVGLRTAFSYFLRGGRPSVAQATTDEEMFI